MPSLADYPKELFNPKNLHAALDEGLITPHELQLIDITLEREQCLTDLWHLTTQVLGYHDMSENIHHPLCNIAQSINPIIMRLNKHKSSNTNGLQHAVQADSASGGRVGGGESEKAPTQNLITFQKPAFNSINEYVEWTDSLHRLFLMFRGSFKTTIISIAHTIQLMLIWPDIRILIASHKKEGGSQEILGAIKSHFVRNERFRKLFPEYCPKANQAGLIEWGTSEKVTLPNRSTSAIFPEATVEIAGLTTDVTGRHYNVIKADDLVTRDSVTNESMLAKTEEYNSLLKFLFDQPEWGILDYCGTPYHFADLYANLREQKDITKVIIPITKPDGEPTFPERFTRAGIERIKHDPSMNSYTFSCQYSLNPVPTEDQIFRPDWWKRSDFYYDKLPQNLKYAVLVDPANTQRKESDYTALLSIGIDQRGDWWLIDIIRDKLTLDQRAKLVLQILKKLGIHAVNYESVGFQSSDIKAIKETGSQADWYISVNEIKASKQSKEDRIRGLQYFYEQGRVHWPKHYIYHSKYHGRDIDMVDVFRRELWMFPKCDKDDLADCHSFILRTNLYKPGVQKTQNQDDAFNWWRQLVIDSKKKPHSPFNGNGRGFNEIPAQKSFR